MPAKKKNTTERQANPAEPKFQGFVNYNPSKEEKEQFNAAAKTHDFIGLYLSDTLMQGYRFSSKYLEANDCFSATLFDANPQSEHAGYCLSVRAGDATQALSRLLYVHAVVCGGDWGIIAAPESDPDRW